MLEWVIFLHHFRTQKYQPFFQDSPYETAIWWCHCQLTKHPSTLTAPQICKRKNHPLLKFSGIIWPWDDPTLCCETAADIHMIRQFRISYSKSHMMLMLIKFGKLLRYRFHPCPACAHIQATRRTAEANCRFPLPAPETISNEDVPHSWAVNCSFLCLLFLQQKRVIILLLSIRLGVLHQCQWHKNEKRHQTGKAHV